MIDPQTGATIGTRDIRLIEAKTTEPNSINHSID